MSRRVGPIGRAVPAGRLPGDMPVLRGVRGRYGSGGVVGLWRNCGMSAAAGSGDSTGDASSPRGRQCAKKVKSSGRYYLEV